MKKKGFLVIILFLLFTTYSCKKNKTPDTIPYFSFSTLDKQKFTSENLNNIQDKIIVYYNSECSHCQIQGGLFSKAIHDFNDLEIIFISYEEIHAIKTYKKTHQLTGSNITFLQDTGLTFFNKFGVEGLPSILTYTKKGDLIKKFEGETEIETILSVF